MGLSGAWHPAFFYVLERITIKKPQKKKTLFIIAAFIVVAILSAGGYAFYGHHQMSKLQTLSADDMLSYTLSNSRNAIITVGIIQNNQASYTVYTKDGNAPQAEHIYEIGSLTKTFTAALVAKGVTEGKINLDHTADVYLDLPDENHYPTIKQLLTHTSGYKAHYFAPPMTGNFFTRRNSFLGISDDMVLNQLTKLSLDTGDHAFTYSNFGYATLGLILQSVYGEDYPALVNRFVQDELGLLSTQISSGSRELDNGWDWQETDAYLAAGALTSTITDMLAYAKLQLLDESLFAFCHQPLATINASSASHMKMGIFMDEIGMSWIIDRHNDMIWHNGATGHYNSYLGFDTKTGIAVVVLSNLAPNDGIPATVLGIKLMQELQLN